MMQRGPVQSRIRQEPSALQERSDAAAALTFADSEADCTEFMRVVTSLMQAWSGCDAVGIRLRLGDDYPYFEFRGFPEEFIVRETRLCALDEQGRPILDGDGQPVLECMCGNVISGRTDPEKPFFTPYGSFWTNSTSELLACTREEDRQGRTRNQCNRAGYESVALIPLRWEGETFGLLQFNDKRVWRFTPDRIALLESLAEGVAKVLSRWDRDKSRTGRATDPPIGRPQEGHSRNLSHALLTPLSAIIGFTDLILDGIDGPLTLDQKNDLRKILANARCLENRLVELIQSRR
jgi:hypothetical protein